MADIRDKRSVYDPQNTAVLNYIDFSDNNGNYKSATLTCADGVVDNYTLSLPAENPVGDRLEKGFINSKMPGANDQVLVATPRVTTDSQGNLVPMKPAVFDCAFKGLASGFYSDFVPIDGVSVPYQGSSIAGIVQAEQVNISYMWTRIGDIVSLHGTAILAGNIAGGTDTKYMDIKLPIPLSNNVPVFSGAVSFISTTPNDSGAGVKGRGANARDLRFFGSCDMITSIDMNQSNVAQWNNFKINLFPKEWSRDTFRMQWVNSSDNSPDAQFRFHVTYSLAPIMKNGGGTSRYVVDRVFSNTDPGNWD